MKIQSYQVAPPDWLARDVWTSPHQLVAVETFHQSKVTIHNLKMGPPGASLSAPIRHDDRTRYAINNNPNNYYMA